MKNDDRAVETNGAITGRGLHIAETKSGERHGALFLTVKEIDREHRRFTAVASTRTIDRHGDIVEPAAIEAALPRYRTNPVLLASHMHGAEDGSTGVIGSVVDIRVKGDQVIIRAELANGTRLADEYWTLIEQEHLRAISIGFLVKGWEQRDVDGREVFVVLDMDLLEISVVAIGANPEALIRMRQLSAETAVLPAFEAATKGLETLCKDVRDALAGLRDAKTMADELADRVVDRLISAGNLESDDLYGRLSGEPDDDAGVHGETRGAGTDDGDEPVGPEMDQDKLKAALALAGSVAGG